MAVSERVADGAATEAEVLAVADAARAIVRRLPMDGPPSTRAAWAAYWCTLPLNRYFAENASTHLLGRTGSFIEWLSRKVGFTRPDIESQEQAALIRDIFGLLPFRVIRFPLSQRSSTVEQLAEAIYHDRAFDRLPVLADALEEAGCTDAAILNHCRQPGVHVRGCWVVDLVLGKE